MGKRKFGGKQNNAGRKWFDGKNEEEIIAKLTEVVALDASIDECCYYADISKDSYYRYLKANPDFARKLERIRERPVLKARQTIVKGLDEADNAKWYLARKKKLEFSERQELTGAEGKDIIIQLSKEIAQKNNVSNPSAKSNSK